MGLGPKPKLNARSVVRLIVVMVLALFALGTTLPELTWIWDPARYGDYGFIDGASPDVGAVSPGSAAAAANIRPGDTIDWGSTSLRQRLELDNDAAPRPGEKQTIRVLRGNTARTVTLIARPAGKTPLSDSVPIILLRAVGVVFIAVGALLVLLRPSRMMWAFYFYAMGTMIGTTTAMFWSFLPAGLFSAIFLGRILLAVGTSVGLYVFALRFPTDTVSGWRRWFEYAAPFIFVFLVWLWPYGYLFKLLVLGQNPQYQLPIPGSDFFIATSLLAGVFLIINYFRSTSTNRQKLKWVVAALAVSYVSNLMYDFSYQFSIPRWLVLTGNVVGVVVPISVAYAVIRHRVFDIAFVISRALVYTIITLIAVVVFSLIDVIFIKMLESRALGFAVDASAAILMGISINRLHGRLDNVVDSIFFRKHHRAEQRVIDLVHELPHARSNDGVNRLLVSEPVEAFQLTSGAVFRRSSKGPYVRQLAVGWPKAGYLELAADDPLVAQLRGLHAATRMPQVKSSSWELPRGDAQPVLALPVVAHNELLAFALYGPHERGTDLDPDEVKAISGLAVGAAVAYEHLEAEALRREIERVRLENEALKTDARAAEHSVTTEPLKPPSRA